jgi:hypothetical protein
LYHVWVNINSRGLDIEWTYRIIRLKIIPTGPSSNTFSKIRTNDIYTA